MAIHNELGKWGEKIAYDYLVTLGYAIVETNWRSGHLELDLIATKGDRIVFVEVKTRGTSVVDPLEAIDRRRVNHMVRAANTFIKSYNIPHEPQFDLIFIIGDPSSPLPPHIEHIPDAFFPPLRTIR